MKVSSTQASDHELKIEFTHRRIVIGRFAGAFRVSDIQRQSPGPSVDLVRQVLKNFESSGRVKCLGRGQSADWQRTTEIGSTQFIGYELGRFNS